MTKLTSGNWFYLPSKLIWILLFYGSYILRYLVFIDSFKSVIWWYVQVIVTELNPLTKNNTLCWFIHGSPFKMVPYNINTVEREMKSLKTFHLSQLMRLWYLSHRWTANVLASLRICAVSPEPLLFAHMKYGSIPRIRQEIRHLAPLDGCACLFEEWVYGGRKVP